jgi:hypothetical protein
MSLLFTVAKEAVHYLTHPEFHLTGTHQHHLTGTNQDCHLMKIRAGHHLEKTHILVSDPEGTILDIYLVGVETAQSIGHIVLADPSLEITEKGHYPETGLRMSEAAHLHLQAALVTLFVNLGFFNHCFSQGGQGSTQRPTQEKSNERDVKQN